MGLRIAIGELICTKLHIGGFDKTRIGLQFWIIYMKISRDSAFTLIVAHKRFIGKISLSKKDLKVIKSDRYFQQGCKNNKDQPVFQRKL